MPLTEEQLAVVQSRSEALKVVAFAGAGKTSTLMAYAKVRPERRMLYLAFNNSIAQEAARKFTRNVTCLTTHSLAYRITGISFRHKLKNNIRANQAAQALGLNPGISSELGLANQSLRALKHFLSTSCVDIEEFALSFAEEGSHKTDAFLGAARLWQAMCDPRNDVMPMLHDGYLKLFQLSAPKLNYDTILFDEAQDANPVTLAIVRQQSCAKIFVGDPHQQIYQFRYAENAMDDPLLNDELFLTESFRFGKEVADAANRLLAVKRERNRIIGGRKVESSSTKACIARGNAFLYKRAALLAQQGGTICWVGGIDGYRLDFLQDMWYLKAERHADIKDRFVAGFQDFDALRGYATAQDERDLTAWIRVIDGHSRWQAIPEEIALVRSRSVDQPQGASLSLSTAHKSKGLEFGSVELADDFPEAELANPVKYSRGSHPIFWDNQGFRGGILLPLEEVNIRYVAITRAEATCASGQWPSPMFNALADYVRRHPRFLTIGEATALGSGIQSTSHPAIQENQTVSLPTEISSNGTIRVYELARNMSLDNKEVLDVAIQLGIAAKSYSSNLSNNDSTRICSWFRDEAARIHNATNDFEIPLHTCSDGLSRELYVYEGMDYSQTSKGESRTAPQAKNVLSMASVVSAYEQRYPVLHWQFLAQCWQQGTADVEGLLNGHPLQSARKLVEAFVDALALTLIDASPKAPEKSGDDSRYSLPALISHHYDLSLINVDECYNSKGWMEAGRVHIPCPYCASKPTVAFYRPRDDKNQLYEHWYRQNWALFCTNCAVISAPRNPELLRVEWNRGTFRKTSR